MTSPDRRRFLKLSASAGAAAMLGTALPDAIAKAMAIAPDRRSGSLADVEHVVILMQENRSFDHYFGSLRGVRGFADPHPINLPGGKPVWYQPSAAGSTDYVLPFRPAASDLGLQFIEDLPHGWNDTHAAWNGGHYDGWVPAKGSTAMAYLTREDIPFHYALADAFTICDAYHCSLLSSTDPNRYYMWTGYVGNDGEGGGPVIDNAELGYRWTTYPERLEQAGVSWKIYQDIGDGLDAAGHWGWTSDAYIGNYGDNSLLYFDQFRHAQPGSALYEKARGGTEIKLGGGLLDQLKHDVQHGSLPQVSWLVAPEAYSEHPNWPANYGAWYIAQVLETLTADPVLWSRTVLLLTYDENDGFFDHLPPPFPPGSAAQGQSTVSTEGEFYTPEPGSSYVAGHYGLGVRVPMIVVSPWSRGGWVCSQVFDHTSIIRLLEQRFGVPEPHISPWRRAICGDLTAAFDFSGAQRDLPALPATGQYAPPDQLRHENYRPQPPQTGQLPSQEPGVRPARALPYAVTVDGHAEPAGRLRLDIANRGQAGVSLLVTSSQRGDGPWSYTVEAGKQVSAQWEALPAQTSYQFSVYGPNGFLREFAGSLASADAAPQPRPEVRLRLDETGHRLRLTLSNAGDAPAHFRVQANAYSDQPVRQYQLLPGASLDDVWDIGSSAHWYDLSVSLADDPSFLRRLAGHHETGRASLSDPALGLARRTDPRIALRADRAA